MSNIDVERNQNLKFANTEEVKSAILDEITKWGKNRKRTYKNKIVYLAPKRFQMRFASQAYGNSILFSIGMDVNTDNVYRFVSRFRITVTTSACDDSREKIIKVTETQNINKAADLIYNEYNRVIDCRRAWISANWR